LLTEPVTFEIVMVLPGDTAIPTGASNATPSTNGPSPTCGPSPNQLTVAFAGAPERNGSAVPRMVTAWADPAIRISAATLPPNENFILSPRKKTSELTNANKMPRRPSLGRPVAEGEIEVLHFSNEKIVFGVPRHAEVRLHKN
jgi:hypothetical protein